jgi:putative PEP-CTERM system histidine kinase
MSADAPAILWLFAGYGLHLGGAIAATTAGVWVAGRRDRFGNAGVAIVIALFLTAVWCLSVSASGEAVLAASVAEAARNLAWLFVVYRLFVSDGRFETQAPIRLVVGVLAFVEFVQLAASYMLGRLEFGHSIAFIGFEFTILLRLMITVGALVLVHNLYAGASPQSRHGLRWTATGLAVLWAFDLNLFTIAYLSGGWPAEISASRGIATMVLAGLIAIGASKDGEVLRLRPSRAVAFQTISLLVIGIYLVAMVAIAQWLAVAGGNFARLIGLGFLTLASVVAILVLPSARLRGWIKVTLAKHLFQHRYDYRAEWLRFTRTIGNTGDEVTPLSERAVKAVADIAESPAGLLLSPGEHGDLVLAARWQWPGIEVPAVAMEARAVGFFESEGFIADLDDVREGHEIRGEAGHVPAWLLDDPKAWAIVPLIHFEQLVGLVVLARPVVARKFDWEDFDLLRVVGQQLASYLAENTSQQALAESSRFDDFHRRIAFVMHDIKNLASQLSLLARNAELHAEKPEFRKDMLVTLRNSSDKLTTLLARLSRYGGNAVQSIEEVVVGDVARAAVERFRGGHSVMLVECQDCTAMANHESLEQVLVHLIQNGIDASEAVSPVFLSVTCDGMHATIEVVDSGCGMDPEFVRNRLFKPFVSSKQGGFGIGAFEARELVRAMRGRLDVESREGLGSRFAIRLPLAEASNLLGSIASNDLREAS